MPIGSLPLVVDRGFDELTNLVAGHSVGIRGRLTARAKLRRPAQAGAQTITLHTNECWRTNDVLPRTDRAASFTRLLGARYRVLTLVRIGDTK